MEHIKIFSFKNLIGTCFPKIVGLFCGIHYVNLRASSEKNYLDAFPLMFIYAYYPLKEFIGIVDLFSGRLANNRVLSKSGLDNINELVMISPQLSDFLDTLLQCRQRLVTLVHFKLAPLFTTVKIRSDIIVK